MSLKITSKNSRFPLRIRYISIYNSRDCSRAEINLAVILTNTITKIHISICSSTLKSELLYIFYHIRHICTFLLQQHPVYIRVATCTDKWIWWNKSDELIHKQPKQQQKSTPSKSKYHQMYLQPCRLCCVCCFIYLYLSSYVHSR